MVDEDIEDLKRLSPEERIAKLREIEKKRKKELEEAEKLMRESYTEIEDKEKEKRKVPIPQVKADEGGMADVFVGDEKELWKTKRFVSERPIEEEKPEEGEALERRVIEEEARERSVAEQADIEARKQYQINLSKQPIEQLDNRLKAYEQLAKSGNMTEEQKEAAYNVTQAAWYKQEAVQEGAYKASAEEIRDIADRSKNLRDYLRG